MHYRVRPREIDIFEDVRAGMRCGGNGFRLWTPSAVRITMTSAVPDVAHESARR